MELAKIISERLNKTIVHVRYEKHDGNYFIYLGESNNLFESTRYDGYIKHVSSERDGDDGFRFTSTYRVVLLLDKTMCDEDVIGFIMNIELHKTNSKNINKIRIKRHFLDSNENVKKEMKDNTYLKYKVIIVEIEVKEQFCKTKIQCNG